MDDFGEFKARVVRVEGEVMTRQDIDYFFHVERVGNADGRDGGGAFCCVGGFFGGGWFGGGFAFLGYDGHAVEGVAEGGLAALLLLVVVGLF